MSNTQRRDIVTARVEFVLNSPRGMPLPLCTRPTGYSWRPQDSANKKVFTEGVTCLNAAFPKRKYTHKKTRGGGASVMGTFQMDPLSKTGFEKNPSVRKPDDDNLAGT